MIFYSIVLRSILYCMSFRRSYNFPVGVGPIVLCDYRLVVKEWLYVCGRVISYFHCCSTAPPSFLVRDTCALST
jgi:hypothetical protein